MQREPLAQTVSFFLAVLACAPTVRAQKPEAPEPEALDALPAGHSHQGAAFHEGPRQFAYLMGGTGDVHFPIESLHEDAQAFFNQGMGQLHGFWYLEAERSFRQVAWLDGDCAMAYWGMAMANVDNEERAQGFAHAAWRRSQFADAPGRAHIDALARFYGVDDEDWVDPAEAAAAGEEADGKEGDAADKSDDQKNGRDNDKRRRQRYITDLEEILFDHPDHIETVALLVNQLWLNTRKGIPISSKQGNQALLDKVFAHNPNHPAHHYRIHLWDSNSTAKRVTDAAAQSGPCSPAVAHQWHMAGHIWAKLDRHHNAAWSQEASARVDHAHMMRDRVMPDEIHNFAHNNEWLTRSLRHVGRIDDAVDLAKNMLEMPRHPEWNTLTGGRSGSARYGRRNLIETLEMFEQWDTLLELSQTMYLEPAEHPSDQGRRLHALGQAHSARGDIDALRANRDALAALLADEVTDDDDNPDDAGTPDTDAKGDRAAPSSDDAYGDDDEATPTKPALSKRQRRTLNSYLKVQDGLLAIHAGNEDEGFEMLKDGKAESFLRARLLLAAGRNEDALEIAQRAARNPKGQLHPLAQLAWIQEQAGERERATRTFESLRPRSAQVQLNAPPFARLAPLAAALGYDADWRVSPDADLDAGQSLDLDELGPRYWAPTAAPTFSLADGRGRLRTLDEFRGQPVVVVFFLGFGCVHCVEQLQAMRPLAQRFRDAGIELLAIGTETAEDLAATIDAVPSSERYPFPILANPDMTAFQRFRAFDDFEVVPLHGTFLIDGSGLVRWQDVGPEPYMEIEFLLGECQRLLALPLRDARR